jgi:hypothetical protein
LRESSVPPKRPSCAACRYIGSPSRYFDVITQASAASLSTPLGITWGGLAARRRPPSLARARVLHPLVADHAHLLRNNIHLLADLHADLKGARPLDRLLPRRLDRAGPWPSPRGHSCKGFAQLREARVAPTLYAQLAARRVAYCAGTTSEPATFATSALLFQYRAPHDCLAQRFSDRPVVPAWSRCVRHSLYDDVCRTSKSVGVLA